MMLGNVIALALIVLSLLVIIFVVVKKFPQLINLDIQTMPEVKAEATKQRLLKERLERKLAESGRIWRQRCRPVFNFLNSQFKKYYHLILELEKKYRQKFTIPRTLKEKSRIDEATTNLVTAGDQLLATEEFEAAEKKFIEAIHLDKHNVGAYQGLGELYWRQGKLAEAKETFEYILKLNADNYDAYSHLGRIAGRQGEWEKARDYHLKSLAADSQAAVHYLDLAQVYRELGQNDDAYEGLEKAVGLEPNNPRNLDALLDLSIMMGKKKEARTVLKKLKEVNPENQKIAELESRIRKIKNLPS